MKMRTIATIGTAVASLFATCAFAEATFTKGTVKKIDEAAGKVTLIHEELVDLEMPAMTMVFVLADKGMAQRLSPGDAIEFSAQRINGKLTVTAIR